MAAGLQRVSSRVIITRTQKQSKKRNILFLFRRCAPDTRAHDTAQTHRTAGGRLAAAAGLTGAATCLVGRVQQVRHADGIYKDEVNKSPKFHSAWCGARRIVATSASQLHVAISFHSCMRTISASTCWGHCLRRCISQIIVVFATPIASEACTDRRHATFVHG